MLKGADCNSVEPWDQGGRGRVDSPLTLSLHSNLGLIHLRQSRVCGENAKHFHATGHFIPLKVFINLQCINEGVINTTVGVAISWHLNEARGAFLPRKRKIQVNYMAKTRTRSGRGLRTPWLLGDSRYFIVLSFSECSLRSGHLHCFICHSSYFGCCLVCLTCT